ncbi:MAG: HD domain-containing protein [Campylobacterota bacterium]|nr:HD domain-containing protein [Campylobacterota bacterium]
MTKYNKLRIKLVIFVAIIIIVVVISSRFITTVLSDITESFDYYKNNASDGQIALLSISSDMNYISRCTRNIMLGDDYEENIEKIYIRKESIKKNFNILEHSLTGTDDETKKLDYFNKSKKATLLFIDDAIKKMKTLSQSDPNKRHQVYLHYKSEATPLAKQSKEYFKKLSTIKHHGFDILTNKFYEDIQKQQNIISLITIFVVLIILIGLLISLNNIKSYFQAKTNLAESNNFLLQYKKIIDLTNIVSKTDKKGIITYVNQKFCDISKYKEHELLGKPHNTVRSPDTPKDLFKDMWKNIKSKKPFHGIIKNQSKDGESYYVDTTIMPILDNKNNITEYMAIRKDVTDIVELNLKLVSSQDELLTRMGMIAETKSKETGDHVKRVAEYCKILATALELPKEDIDLIFSASALHDMGKVGTPDHILNKPGRLTKEEFDVMKQHSLNGYEMLKDSKNDIIKTGSIIALEHHEKYDGTGYPNGLKGEDIHIFARITALADVFDALGESRTYKKAWELNKILDFIKEQKGYHFDPLIVDMFFENIEKILFIRKKYKKRLS